MVTDRLVRLLATLGSCLLLGACATTRVTLTRTIRQAFCDEA